MSAAAHGRLEQFQSLKLGRGRDHTPSESEGQSLRPANLSQPLRLRRPISETESSARALIKGIGQLSFTVM
jgi:hypothetical protein